jgi:hypothetical protein
MLKRIVSRCIVLAAALQLVACLGLPSDQQVAQKFKRDHPACTVQSVSHTMTPFPGETMPVHAVFRIVYTELGDPRPHTFERKFGRVAEGWLERPSNVRD